MCGFTTLSFPAIIRGAATSQNWGCLSFLPPFLLPFFYFSFPPSLLPHPLSFPPFLAQPSSLPMFLFKSLSPLLSLLSTLLSFFLFFSRGPAARHLEPARGVRESCKPGRQTVSVHSEVKTGFWWVVTAVLKRLVCNERQLQVTRETKI